MKTLNIAISDQEFNEWGLNSTDLSFSEFVNIVTRQLAKRHLEESVNLAQKHDLSAMSMEDISREVNAERSNDKNRG